MAKRNHAACHYADDNPSIAGNAGHPQNGRRCVSPGPVNNTGRRLNGAVVERIPPGMAVDKGR